MIAGTTLAVRGFLAVVAAIVSFAVAYRLPPASVVALKQELDRQRASSEVLAATVTDLEQRLSVGPGTASEGRCRYENPEGALAALKTSLRRAVYDATAAEATRLAATEAQKTEPTPENQSSLEIARDVLGRALMAKRWTEEDRAKLRRQLRDMHPAQRKQLMAQTADALNTGQMHAEVEASAF